MVRIFIVFNGKKDYMKKPDLEQIAFKMSEKGLSLDRHNIDDLITERILEEFNEQLSEWTEEVKEWLERHEEKELTKEEWNEKYND